jgi:hypothetical protein
MFEKFEMALENRRLVFFLLFSLLLAAFLPALHTCFLHTDDYFWSYWGDFSFASKLKFMSQVGRPLGAFTYHLMSKFHHMAQYNILRFISFLNICTLAFLTFRWLRSWKIAASAAFFLSVAIFTLPPYQVNVSYLSTGFYGMASTIAMFALLLAKQAYDQKRNYKLAGWSVFLLVLCFCNYQPGGMFYIAMFSVPLLLSRPQTFLKDWHKSIVFYAGILVVAIIIYQILVNIGFALFAPHTPIGGKYDPRAYCENISERIHWYWNYPFVEIANLWRINSNVKTVKIVFAFIFLGPLYDLVEVWLDRKRNYKSFANWALKWVALLSFIPMTYMISLVSTHPSMEYRTYGPSMTVVLILAFFGVYLWLDSPFFKNWKKKYLRQSVPILIAFLGLYMSSRTISDYFTVPDAAEFRSLSMAIERFHREKGPFSEIHIIVGPRTAFDRVDQRGEVGETTMRHPPNVWPMVRAVLSELGIKDPVRITISDKTAPDSWFEWTHTNGDIFTLKPVPVPVLNGPQVLVVDRNEFTQ